MGNMAYCRFRNTSRDMADCEEHWFDDDLTPEEHAARERMLHRMVRILNSMMMQEIDTPKLIRFDPPRTG